MVSNVPYIMSDDVNFLCQLFHDSMELQAQESLGKSDDRETEIMKPLQVFTYMIPRVMHIIM